MIRKEFFKSLRYPYLTNATPNKRHDGLNIARAVYAVDNNVLKTELNEKGNVTMQIFLGKNILGQKDKLEEAELEEPLQWSYD